MEFFITRFDEAYCSTILQPESSYACLKEDGKSHYADFLMKRVGEIVYSHPGCRISFKKCSNRFGKR